MAAMAAMAMDIKSMGKEQNLDWDVVLEAKKSWFDLKFREIWGYRDLIVLLVRRDFVSLYKQTILGPLWFFIQPLFTTIIFTVIFGQVAKISTDGIPQPIFYMSGIILWNYFAECLTKTSDTFITNQGIFGKVYFPRLIVPISVVISNLLKFFVQALLLLGFYLFYMVKVGLEPNVKLLLLPIYIGILAILGLALGLIITSLTTKYRDLKFLVQFGVQLAMYATPIVYPLSIIDPENRLYFDLNPVTSIVEAFRFGLFGQGSFSIEGLGYSFLLSIALLVLGMLVFNKIESDFVDTV